MGQALEPQSLGESRTYKLTCSGVGDDPSLAGDFTGAENLVATLSRGANYAPSATVAAEWDTSIAGNPETLDNPVLLLTITRLAIAGLTPGTYQVLVVADPDAIDQVLFSGSIRLTAAAGVAALPRLYAGYQDMIDEFAAIDLIEDLEEARATQFTPELDRATEWVEEQAMARWEAANDSQMRRHGAVAYVVEIVPTAGYDAGPGWGASTIPDTTTRTARAAFSALLDSKGLMTAYGPDRGRLRRMTALYALYLAMDDQMGEAREGTSYQSLAMKYRAKALAMLPGTTFYLDSDADGVPEVVLEP